MSRVKEAFQENGITIENVPRKGIKLEASVAQRNDMYNHMQELAYSTPETKEYRKEYILKTLFEYSDNYTVQLFAEDLFVSKKIISRDLKEIEEFLLRYNVRLIIRRSSGIMMKGNEFDVRQAMISHYNSLWWYKKYDEKPDEVDLRISRRAWTYMNQMYGDLDLIEMQKALLLAEQELGFIWTDIAFSRLLEYIVVSKRRIQKNWIVETANNHMLLPLEDIYIQAAGKLLERVAGKKAAVQEIQYLAARIYIAETVCPRISKNSERFQVSVRRYLEQVGYITAQKDFSQDTELMQKICETLSVIQYKENYNIADWNDSNREAKKNISALYGVCLMQMYILEEGTGLKFRQDDIAQITIFVKNYMARNRKEAVFVTATDAESAFYQLEKLKNAFKNIHFLETVHYQRFNLDLYPDRLIISSVDLKQKNAEVYKITKHVNEEDIARLAREFEKESECRKSWRKLFYDELMWEISARDKADAVGQICDTLKATGYVSEDFEEKLWEQENRTATSIGNRTALPHVFDEHVKKEFIAVIKLKHRILWDHEEQAEILFVTAARPEHIPEVSGFILEYKEIYSKDSKMMK